MMLQMLQPHLEELDVTPPVGVVHTAQDPDSALATLARMSDGPLAVLSDFNLKAHMNGVDLLREVSKRSPLAVRILFSGYAEDQLGGVTDDDAVHGFVEKPLRIREMLPPLREIIQRQVGASPSERP